MTASTPRRLPSGSRTTGMPPPPAATTTWPALDEHARRADVEHLERLGRGDDPAPALLAAVLPHLAVVDEGLRLLAREVAPDRLARVGEARVVAVDEGAGDEGGHGGVEPGIAQRVVEGVQDREAERPLGLGAAPVQRDRRHDVGGELVLDQDVADLRAVAVGDDQLVAGGDQSGGGPHRDADRLDLGGRGGAAVGARSSRCRPGRAGPARQAPPRSPSRRALVPGSRP